MKFRFCKRCGDPFLIGNNKNQVYCGNLCKPKKKRKYSKSFYKLRFEIFKRDDFTCQYCGRNVKEDKIKIHCDHIIPVSKGGKNIPKNLITSCAECNLGKNDVLLNVKKISVK